MRKLVVAVLLLSVVPAGFAQNPPYFPYPANDKIKLEDCIPGAVTLLKRLGLLPGERVLIVTDRSLDPMATDAFYVAAWRLGAGSVDVIDLQGRLDVTDPGDVTAEVVEKDWWPKWVWDAAATFDRVLAVCFLDRVHVMHSVRQSGRGFWQETGAASRLVKEWEEKTGVRFDMIWFDQHRERLATSTLFPYEIQDALLMKLWKILREGKEFHMTDPNGTDLTWTFDDVTWPRYFAAFGNTPTNHAPRMHQANPPNMRGLFVTTKAHPGMIPRMEVKIEGGRVVEIKGGGKAGDHWRAAIEKYKDLRYPGFPGPGVNWVEYVAIGWANPWLAPVSNAADLAWSAKFWGEELDQRTGVMHMGIGTSYAAQNYNFAKERGISVNHKDFYLVRPTITVDGKRLVDRGHLVLLDDPDIRALAAKYGDPDKILKERWSPDTDPRFKEQ